jgi:hypothetical protein
MKTVDSTWRNLTKGYDRIRAHENALRTDFEQKAREVRDREHRAELEVWEVQRQRRMSRHENALSAWTSSVVEQRSRVRATVPTDLRRARVAAPAGVVAAVVVALFGGGGTGDIAWGVLIGALLGSLVAFAPTGWSAARLAFLHSKKPTLNPAQDPRPRPGEPLDLNLADHWWREISDNDNEIRSYGDEGEVPFYELLTRALPDDHVGVRGVLVKAKLDVDIIVVGSTAVWVFEVKHWAGTITCHDGNWSRTKHHGDVEWMKPFDDQWSSECREVKETLRRRVRPSHLADKVTGGLVFTHPGVSLDLAGSECDYGNPDQWVATITAASRSRRGTLGRRTQLEILDALLDRAKQVDRQNTRRHCAVELADGLALELRERVQRYLTGR